MKGHSGGVSSAVEIVPAIPTNLTKSSHTVAAPRAADSDDRSPGLTPRQVEAATDVRRRGRAGCRFRCSDSFGAVPACGTVSRRSREAVALQPSVLRLRRVALAPVRGSRQRTPGRGVGQHRQGGRRQRRRLGADRLLPQLPRSFALLGHRAGGRHHRRTHRRARGRAADLHSAAPAGQVAPPDRDRRHRRPCGAPVAHVPAASRPRLRGPRASSARKTSASAAASGCSAPSTTSNTILHEYGANGVVVSPSLPDHEINALARRLTDLGYHVALSSSLRDIDMTGCARNSSTGTPCSTSSRSSATDGARWRSGSFDVTAACTVLDRHVPRAARGDDRDPPPRQGTGVLPPGSRRTSTASRSR